MAFQTEEKQLTKLQVKLVNSEDTSPYQNSEVPGPHSQPAQLWGNTELLSALIPLKFRARDRVDGDMEKMMLWKHGTSALC